MCSLGETVTSKSANDKIHLIDFKPWVDEEPREARLKVAKELVEAGNTLGFVYISNHGISEELVVEAFSWSKRFFDLKEEEKTQAAHPLGSDDFRGWSKIGHETVPPHEEDKLEGVLDYNESYGVGSDTNEAIPNVWIPESTLPGFKAFIKKFYAECWRTSQLVLRALSLGLGMEDESYLLQFHDESENELSIRHYPPVSATKIESGELDRLGAHTDFDTFTILFQDRFGGLKVKHPNTKTWIDASPVEGALVMNIGDVLARWSNDYLVSTIHRVHLPPTEDSYSKEEAECKTKDRYSIPYFVLPKRDTILECLDVCWSEDRPKRYKPLMYRELYAEKVEGYFKKDVEK